VVGAVGLTTITDNESDSPYQLAGRSNTLIFSRNIITTAAGTNQLTMDDKPFGLPGLATEVTTLIVEDNFCLDAHLTPDISLTNISPSVLRSKGNNFQIQASTLQTLPTQNIYKVATGGAAGAGIFPYGIEFLAGDEVVDTDSAMRWTVKSAGSANRISDNCTVYSNVSNTLQSTSYPWSTLTGGGYHSPGQQIKITNIGPGGTTLSTTVLRVYQASGLELMDIAGSISAVNGTAVTITANSPVGYSQV
jgi:hypothetical protein